MAKRAFVAAFVEVDGNEITNYCSEVSFEGSFDEVDVTGFKEDPDTPAYREIVRGLGDATVTMNVFRDSVIDGIFWPLFQSGETFVIRFREGAEPASFENPEYSMSTQMFNYALGGAVGAALTQALTFRNATQDGLQRSFGSTTT